MAYFYIDILQVDLPPVSDPDEEAKHPDSIGCYITIGNKLIDVIMVGESQEGDKLKVDVPDHDD